MPLDPEDIRDDIVTNVETDTGNDMVDAASVVWLAVCKALAPYIDAAASGSGLFPNSVTDVILRDSTPLSVIGNPFPVLSDPSDIVALADGDILRRSGTTLGFGAILESSVTGLVADLAARPTGSGTTNKIPVWTSSTSIGNSTITDTGTLISTSTPVTLAGAFTLSTLTQGSILFIGSSGLVTQDNASLFFDNANNRVGIGTATPSNPLHVRYATSSDHEAALVELTDSSNDSAALQVNNVSPIGGPLAIKNLNPAGPVDFYAVDSTNTLRLSWGYGNATYADTARVGRGYLWRNTGVDFVFSRSNTVDGMLFSDGNFNFGTSTANPSVKLRVQGKEIVTNGTSGAATANTNTVIQAENSTQCYVELRAPTATQKGVLFSNPTASGDGAILYDGVARSLQFNAANTTYTTITATGEAIFGINKSAVTKTGFSASFEVTRDAAAARILLTTYGTGVNSTLYLYHGRGTAASTTVLQNADGVGAFAFTGATGSGNSDFFEGASVIATTTENWSLASNFGTKLDFRTTKNASGSGGRAIRFTIDHDGFQTMTADGTSDVLSLRNTDATGFNALAFRDSGNTLRGATGYGNATASDTAVRNLLYWRTLAADMVFTTGSGSPSTPRLRLFNSTGNIIIGTDTSDPSIKLRVQGTVSGHTLTVDNSGGQCNVQIIGTTAGASYTGYVVSKGTFSSTTQLWYIGRDGTGNTDGLIFRRSSTTDDGKIDTSGNWTIGAANTASHTIAGRAALTNTTSTASAFTSTHTPVAGATNTTAAGIFTNNGTYTTAGGALSEYAVRAVASSTRSAGASDLTNVALYASASGAQVNVGLHVDDGSVQFDSTLNVDGAVTFTSTLAVTGAITEGGVPVLAGSITANVIPKGSGGNLTDSGISDTGTVILFDNRRTSDTYTGSGTLTAWSMTGTGLTVSGVIADYSSSATYDTTGGALSATGAAYNVFGSKSAGAAQFTQTAILANAEGADANYAIRANNGDCLFNATTGSTYVGYTTGTAPTTQKLGVRVTASTTTTAFGISNALTSISTHIGASISLTTTVAAPANRTATGITTSVTTSKASGAGTLTNKAGVFTATNGDVNIALETTDGNLYLATTSGNVSIGVASGGTQSAVLHVAGTFLATGAATFNDNVTLNNASTETTSVIGHLGVGTTADGNAQIIIDQIAASQYGIYHTDTTTANTENRLGIQLVMIGTYDCTAADRTSFGISGGATGARSAGANSLYNIAVYANAENGQVNIGYQSNNGSNFFNTASGNTGIGYAISASIPRKLSVTGDAYISTTLEVDGAFDHDGSTFGVLGTAPAVQQTIVALTDSSGGTANDTVQALTDPADSPGTADNLRDDLVANLIPELRNNFADLAAKINEIRSKMGVTFGFVA